MENMENRLYRCRGRIPGMETHPFAGGKRHDKSRSFPHPAIRQTRSGRKRIPDGGPLRCMGKRRQCLPGWFIYSYFDADKGFSCHWIQKPFGRIRQRPQGKKTVFHGFHSMWKKRLLKTKALFLHRCEDRLHIPATIKSTDMGQIRPERSACGSARPWR